MSIDLCLAKSIFCYNKCFNEVVRGYIWLLDRRKDSGFEVL